MAGIQGQEAASLPQGFTAESLGTLGLQASCYASTAETSPIFNGVRHFGGGDTFKVGRPRDVGRVAGHKDT